MENSGDNILIEQTLNGNTVAFTHLVNRYKAMVFAIVVKVVLNKEDAEECAQDVFIKVYQALNTYKRSAKFSTWLYRIAFNAAISHKRKKKISAVELNETIYQTLTDDEIFCKFETWNDNEQRKAIDKAIEHLPPDEAVIITLFYMDEKSVDDVAFITGLSQANVKVKLHRARKKMYAQLSKLMEVI